MTAKPGARSGPTPPPDAAAATDADPKRHADATDASRAEEFFRRLLSMPRLARFVPTKSAFSEQARRQGRYFRDVLGGLASRDRARRSGEWLVRSGVPISVAIRGARHHLLAELRGASASVGAASAATLTARVLDDLVVITDAYEHGEGQRLARLHRFDRAVSDLRGAAWFDAMAAHARVETGADIVFVGEMTEDRDAVSMMALSSSDPAHQPFGYPLAGTPCEQVLRGAACVYPHQVAPSFPDDKLLAEMAIEGYLGVPLLAAGERPVGLIVALFKRPVTEYQVSLDTLERLSRRAVAELLRRRHASAIQRERAEFEAILATLPDLAVVHQDGQVVWVNDIIRATGGYPDVAGVLGRPLVDFLHPDDRANAAAWLAGTLATGQPASAQELRVLRADGSAIHIEWTATPVTRNGRPAVVAIGRDLSERRRLQGQARHLDRLSFAGALSGILSHEINNPLTFMQASLSLGLERLEPWARADERPLSAAQVADMAQALQEDLAAVTTGCRRIGAAVRSVQRLVDADTTPLERTSLCDAVDAAVQQAMALHGDRLSLTHSHSASPAVLAEPVSLGLAIDHVLRNAVDASLAHASRRAGPASAHVSVTVGTSGADARVLIEDDGAGIPRALLGSLFEPFVTSKMRGVGSGLGLSVARDVIERLGGHIEAENRAEGGARVTLTIPLAG